MSQRIGEFTVSTQQQALARQHYKCASCGTNISGLGQTGQSSHLFGEGAQAHHVWHLKSGGPASLDNCVILCQSCHYSAHEGGNYRYGTVEGRLEGFPHYNG